MRDLFENQSLSDAEIARKKSDLIDKIFILKSGAPLSSEEEAIFKKVVKTDGKSPPFTRKELCSHIDELRLLLQTHQAAQEKAAREKAAQENVAQKAAEAKKQKASQAEAAKPKEAKQNEVSDAGQYVIFDSAYYSHNSKGVLKNKLDLVEQASGLAKSIFDPEVTKKYSEKEFAKLAQNGQGPLQRNFVNEVSRYGYRQLTGGKKPESFHQVAQNLADAYGITLPQAYFATALVMQRSKSQASEIAAENAELNSQEKGKEESGADSENSALNFFKPENAETNSPFQLGFLFRFGSEVFNVLALQLASRVEIPVYPEKKRKSQEAEFYVNFSDHQVFEIAKGEDGSCKVSFIASGTITYAGRDFIPCAKFQIFKQIVIANDLSVTVLPDVIRFSKAGATFTEALEKAHSDDNKGLLAAGVVQPNIFVTSPSDKKASEFELPPFFAETQEKLKRAEIFEQLYQVSEDKDEVARLDTPENTNAELLRVLNIKLQNAWLEKQTKILDILVSENDPLLVQKEILKKYIQVLDDGLGISEKIAVADSVIAALVADNEESYKREEGRCFAFMGKNFQEYRLSVEKACVFQDLNEVKITGNSSLSQLAEKLQKQYVSLSVQKETDTSLIQQMLIQVKALAGFLEGKETIKDTLDAFHASSAKIRAGLDANLKPSAEIEKTLEEIEKELIVAKRNSLVSAFHDGTILLGATLTLIEKTPDKTDVRFASISDARDMIREGEILVQTPAILDDTVEKMTVQVKALNNYFNSDQSNIVHNFNAYSESAKEVVEAAQESDQKSRLGVQNNFWKYVGIGLTILSVAAIGIGAGLVFGVGAGLTSLGLPAFVGIPLMAGGILLGMAAINMVNTSREQGWKKADNNIQRLFTQSDPSRAEAVAEALEARANKIPA